MSRNILLISFGPFAGRRINGSSTLSNSLRGSTIGDYAVVNTVLTVRWGEPERRLPGLLADHSPALILGLGEGKPDGMCFEAVGVNHARGEDSTGAPPPQPHLEADGPRQRQTRLAFDESWFDDNALAFTRSDDAGGLLCNNLLYVGLRLIDAPFGFVHLPPQEERPDAAYLDSGIKAHVRRLLERNIELLSG